MSGRASRPPVVAGQFYEAVPNRLREQVAWCFDHPIGPRARPCPWGTQPVAGLIVPHAALLYSGPVAAHAYLRLAQAPKPALVVIVGPDHHGRGARISLAPQSRWHTPLGDVVTEHHARDVLREAGLAVEPRGHDQEHCIEVQLPFLQVLGFDGPVLPIVMAEQDAETVAELVEALSAGTAGLDVVFMASTDLSHYLPHDQATATDRRVLDALETGTGQAVLDVAARWGVSMCGAGPAAVVLEAAARRGATRVRVLRYATSGDTGGDHAGVVGYAAVAVEAA